MQRYALFSLSKKNPIFLELAKELVSKNYKILATESTMNFLKENGVEAYPLSKITGFNELLGGKIKSINHILHSMILCDRDSVEEVEEIKNYGFIDFVVVNLYSLDFQKTDLLFKSLDIGGRLLINSAIKNYKHVALIVDEEGCRIAINELRNKESLSFETKQMLALRAFEYLIDYEAKAYTFLYENFTGKLALYMLLKDGKKLRYGENPHQKAYIFSYNTDPDFEIEILKGDLSYNNYLDTNRAIFLLEELGPSSCVIIKHTNPSSAAKDENVKNAFLKAYSADPISAYGGILGINGLIDKELAEIISKHFFDIIIAKDFEEEALKILFKKKARLIKCRSFGLGLGQSYSIRDLINGILVQERDLSKIENFNLQFVSKRKPNGREMKDLIFAWKVVKHAFSNAIVVAKNEVTLGIGCGQTSRIYAAEIALARAGEKAKDSVLASDGFFPFRDSIDLAASKGVSAIIEPGGSIRDKEVIEAADQHGLALVFTGVRSFRH